MDNDCLLCQKYSSRIFESKYFFVVYDDFPLRRGHLLIVSKQHVEELAQLSPVEFSNLSLVLQWGIRHIKTNLRAHGYNLGVNCGEAAGQTLSHLHIHLIPRYAGDVPDPRGGIRHFLPNPLTVYPEER